MNDEKLLNLAGGKVLYDDLRDRIEQTDGELTDLRDAVDGKVTDVQVNGTSVVTDGVANVPKGGLNQLGAVCYGEQYGNHGIIINNSGEILTNTASDDQIKRSLANAYRPITPINQHKSAFYAFAKAAGDTTQKDSSNAVGTYTETAKSKISDMLSAPVSVTGTTPTITALSGIQYVCGEVSTLDITLPASGIVDVVFQSGSTPTVLTITPPTGMTVEWANGFDSTSLEAVTLYELNIKMVGSKCLGVAGTWT